MSEQGQGGSQGGYRGGAQSTTPIVVTTGNEVGGHRIAAYLGVVRGVVVRSASIGAGIVGAFKSLGGGNIEEWATVCDAARQDAYLRMIAHAEALGANAIIAMRYDATEFMQGATEVLAYGTAVRLER
jgi:uncharacterized protein YbjQ (UPF0145 family)